ncbi:MAG: sugar phosphate isomerase/epimerase family protein [Tepidisphaeraceae bacterium]|jgi:sugar phosphate isomerase/epimerase
MKTTPARSVGVQSYCFRHFKDIAEVCKLVRGIGVYSVELCGVHADFADPEKFKATAALCAQSGIRIVSIGVQTFTGDAPRERKWFECAQIAGAKLISAHFTPSTFQSAVPMVAKWCDEFGIRVGIHNHGGYNFGGSPDVLETLLKLGGKNIGITLDTAWCLQIGPYAGDPVKWIKEKFPGRIHGVHYKDFIFDRRAQWSDVIIGAGNLDLPAVVAALESTGFDGPALIEYEADPENPSPALTQCVQKIRALNSNH